MGINDSKDTKQTGKSLYVIASDTETISFGELQVNQIN